MKVKISRRREEECELWLHFPDGSQSRAEFHEVTQALTEQGYILVKARPGNSIEVHAPEEFHRLGDRGR